MTVPNLMQNWKKQERLTQLKVAYSILQNATKMAVALNGHPSTWDYARNGDSAEQRQNLTSQAYAEKYFIPYVKTKDTGKLISEYPDYKIYNIDGKQIKTAPYIRCYVVMLENGMLISIWGNMNSSTNTALNIIDFRVDLNGFKGPNIGGNDVFNFRFYRDTNELIPLGAASSDFNSVCSTNTQTLGWSMSSCAAKIINNGWQFPDDYPIKKF